MVKIALGIQNRQIGKSGQSPSHHGNWTPAKQEQLLSLLELLFPWPVAQGKG